MPDDKIHTSYFIFSYNIFIILTIGFYSTILSGL